MKKNGFAKYQSGHGFASILILIIIVVLGVGFYFLKQSKVIPTPFSSSSPTTTPDPTTDWHTFSNLQYHFSFQYPPTLTLKSKNQNPKDSLHLYFSSTSGQEVARLHVYPNETKDPNPEFFQSEKTINSIPWQVVLFPKGLDYGEFMLTVPILYYITYQETTKYSFQFNDISQISDLQVQILSTFKFTK